MVNYILYGVLALTLLFNITLNFRVNMLELRLESLENEIDIEKYGSIEEAMKRRFDEEE